MMIRVPLKACTTKSTLQYYSQTPHSHMYTTRQVCSNVSKKVDERQQKYNQQQKPTCDGLIHARRYFLGPWLKLSDFSCASQYTRCQLLFLHKSVSMIAFCRMCASTVKNQQRLRKCEGLDYMKAEGCIRRGRYLESQHFESASEPQPACH